jgi:hypothetical protein
MTPAVDAIGRLLLEAKRHLQCQPTSIQSLYPTRPIRTLTRGLLTAAEVLVGPMSLLNLSRTNPIESMSTVKNVLRPVPLLLLLLCGACGVALWSPPVGVTPNLPAEARPASPPKGEVKLVRFTKGNAPQRTGLSEVDLRMASQYAKLAAIAERQAAVARSLDPEAEQRIVRAQVEQDGPTYRELMLKWKVTGSQADWVMQALQDWEANFRKHLIERTISKPVNCGDYTDSARVAAAAKVSLKSMAALEAVATAELEQVLTDEQIKELKQLRKVLNAKHPRFKPFE